VNQNLPSSSAPIDILLVDDDDELRRAMIDLLSSDDHSAVGVSNGVEALAWLRSAERAPRLILLDLMMPVMDGWQFRKEQLADPLLASIPVAVLSSRGNEPLDDAVEVLKKPIRPQLLLDFVARRCAKIET
jgi:CheY-like chemotaxis protein